MAHDGPPPRRGGRGGGTRRQPPPESTGRFGEYLAATQRAGRSVTAWLTDGGSVRGTIVSFDASIVELAPPDGAAVVLRFDDIRVLEDEGA